MWPNSLYFIGSYLLSLRRSEKDCPWRDCKCRKVLSSWLIQHFLQSHHESIVLCNTVKELVVKQMDDELENLCRKQTNSILRQTKPAELVSFDMSKLVCELEKEAPFVWQVLKSVSSSKNKKRAEKRGDQAQDLTTVCATIAATVLHTRCAEMSALAYRIGLLLRYSGAGGMVCCKFLVS